MSLLIVSGDIRRQVFSSRPLNPAGRYSLSKTRRPFEPDLIHG
jgi:hypothetical protein